MCDLSDISICDDCEYQDSPDCQHCCAKCYEDYGGCPNPDCNSLENK